jgi:hypothetical protein
VKNVVESQKPIAKLNFIEKNKLKIRELSNNAGKVRILKKSNTFGNLME